MKQFSTKQLIQILPMDESLRNQLLAGFDNLTPDQRLAIEKLCWTMFFQLLNDQVQYEFQQALLEVKDKKRSLKSNLYQEIKEETFEKLKAALSKQSEKSEVQKVQEELKKHFRKPPTP